MGATRGISTTFWKTCAYVSPALTIAPGPEWVCREHWPVSLSLPKPHQIPSSHSRALSTIPHCFHRKSSSNLISYSPWRLAIKSQGRWETTTKMLCSVTKELLSQDACLVGTTQLTQLAIAFNVSSEQHRVNIQQTPYWLLVDGTQNLFQQLIQ